MTDLNGEVLLSKDDIKGFMELSQKVRFFEIQEGLRSLLGGRLLLPEERQLVTSCIREYVEEQTERQRLIDDAKFQDNNYNILVFTAFSEDYSIGYICEYVNALYCGRHNYIFKSFVKPYKDILDEISPKTHCTWYKVYLINHLLKDTEFLSANNIRYIMWIDGDALFINHDISLQSIIKEGRFRDLIVSEDMNPCCLINAGVLIIRVCEWSCSLWRDVWDCKNYDNVFFYEQSALLKVLKARREGLDRVKPFHSYLGTKTKKGKARSSALSVDAVAPIKFFAHVSVFNHLLLNTNRGWKISRKGRNIHQERAKRKVCLQQAWNSLEISESETEKNELTTTISNDVAMALVSRMESLWREYRYNPLESTSVAIDDDPLCQLDTLDKDEPVLQRIDIQKESEEAQDIEKDDKMESSEMARFIFHPAGVFDKLSAIKAILDYHDIQLPSILANIDSFFLLRKKIS